MFLKIKESVNVWITSGPLVNGNLCLYRSQLCTGDLKVFCFAVDVSRACVISLQLVSGQGQYNFGEALARTRNNWVNQKY